MDIIENIKTNIIGDVRTGIQHKLPFIDSSLLESEESDESISREIKPDDAYRSNYMNFLSHVSTSLSSNDGTKPESYLYLENEETKFEEIFREYHTKYNNLYTGGSAPDYINLIKTSKSVPNDFDMLENTALKDAIKTRIENLKGCKDTEPYYYKRAYDIENTKSMELEGSGDDENYVSKMAQTIPWGTQWLPYSDTDIFNKYKLPENDLQTKKGLMPLKQENIESIIRYFENTANIQDKMMLLLCLQGKIDNLTKDNLIVKLIEYLGVLTTQEGVEAFCSNEKHKIVVLGFTRTLASFEICKYPFTYLYQIGKMTNNFILGNCVKPEFQDLIIWNLRQNDLFLTLFSKIKTTFPIIMYLPPDKQLKAITPPVYDLAMGYQLDLQTLFRDSTYIGVIILPYKQNEFTKKWVIFVFKNNSISQNKYQSTQSTNRQLTYFCINKTLHLCEFTRIQTNRSITYREIISLNEMMPNGIYRFNVTDDSKYKHALLFTRLTNEELNVKLDELGVRDDMNLIKVKINRYNVVHPATSQIQVTDDLLEQPVASAGGKRVTHKSGIYKHRKRKTSKKRKPPIKKKKKNTKSSKKRRLPIKKKGKNTKSSKKYKLLRQQRKPNKKTY